MILKNWSVVNPNPDPYKAPELQKGCLHGEVYGHPRFEDGHRITTSSIVGLDGDYILTYSGSEYELGDVDSEYEKIYPDVRERLFKSLRREL